VHSTVPAANPFDSFERIGCTRFQAGDAAWEAMQRRLARLDLDGRTLPEPVERRVVDVRVGIAMAQRRMIAAAVAAGARQLLVFDEQTLLLADAATHLAPVVEELAGREWSLLYLGAATRGEAFTPIPGCQALAECSPGTAGLHGLVYHRRVMEQLLDTLPISAPRMGDWIVANTSYDHYLATLPGRLLARPVIASLPALLPYEDVSLRESFLT
jgi:hypothetical protein